MIMDWLHDGSQAFHLTRKCHKLRQTESDGDTNCYEGQNSYIQFKDCYNMCTGNGCNNNSDVVNANSRLDENDDLIEIRLVLVYCVKKLQKLHVCYMCISCSKTPDRSSKIDSL